MARQAVRVGWALGFLAVLLVPLILYAIRPDTSPVPIRMSILAGLLATSALLASVVLSSRLRSLTTTFGLGRVVGLHRYMATWCVLLVAVHVGVFLAYSPASWVLLLPWSGTPASQAGLTATVALVALGATSRLRERHYELWRWLHIAFAALAIVLAGLHVYWLNHLITDPYLRVWFVGASALLLAVLTYRWLLRPIRHRRTGYVVTAVRAESPGVSTLTVRPPGARHHTSGPSTLTFEPGQFAWLRLSPTNPSQEHPYTISSSAADPSAVEFTIRHTGDFSDRLAGLQPGQRLWMDGPHGAFTLSPGSAGVVGIVAGVGITPVMSILRTLADRHDRRSHRLVVASRTPEDMLFRRELDQLRNRLPLSVLHVLSRPPHGWIGPVGRINAPMLERFLPDHPYRTRLDYFVCGPPAMIADTLAALAQLRIPASRVHTEQFGDTPARRAPDEADPNAAIRPVDPGRDAGPGSLDSGTVRVPGLGDTGRHRAAQGRHRPTWGG